MEARSARGDVPVGEGNLEILINRQIVQQVIALEDESHVLFLQRKPLFLIKPMN
jgi:hypothetical protein